MNLRRQAAARSLPAASGYERVSWDLCPKIFLSFRQKHPQTEQYEPRLEMHMKLLIVAAVVAAELVHGNAIANDFTLTIARKFSSADCTSGYLAVNGAIQAYTLELPWQGNAPLISSIPVGTYSGTLRYDHADQWRIELQGVPGRSHVEIHTGNTPDDSEGCILVGKQLDDDLCSIKPGTSKPAYQDLKNAFYGSPNPVSTPDKIITVKVEQ